MYFPQLPLSLLAILIATATASDHEAHMYASDNCGSSVDRLITNFGCGGTCWNTADGWESIFLQYSGSGVKPTADCYATSDCSGSVVNHNGVEDGSNTGCSNQRSVVHSCFLYFGC